LHVRAHDERGFGVLLREYRRAADLTQGELAERAGISVRTISDLESGVAHVPRRETIDLLLRALPLEREQHAALVANLTRRRGPRSIQPSSSSRAHGHMPESVSSFVGRERELLELNGLLRRAPLLTLVGPGGVGKTRLAVELVRTHDADYPDGVWFVELAPLND